MPIDIFDTERPAPDRVFRYPLYERFLWVVVLVVGVVAAVFFGHIREFVAAEGPRALAVLAVVVFFLFVTVWISLRAWISKVVISPVSLKARVFGQGVQRISWMHIQRVVYKWRPLGHKLIFIGSDGARVTFRSCIKGYDELIGFIRDSAPEPVVDQLEAILGEEEPEEKDESAEAPAPPPPPEAPEPAPAPEAPAPSAEEPAAKAPEAEEEEAGEEEPADEGRRRWWWVFLGK